MPGFYAGHPRLGFPDGTKTWMAGATFAPGAGENFKHPKHERGGASLFLNGNNLASEAEKSSSPT
jgi:hypothetical protein